MDGIIPNCKTDVGCIIPPLLPGPAKAREILKQLAALRDLNIGSEILRMHGATLRHLDLMMVEMQEAKENAPPPPDKPPGDDEDFQV